MIAAGPTARVSRGWLIAAVAAIIAVGVARIVATYPVFSNTYDEGAHIAAGMEWLERGTYTFDQEHPPLARLAAAALPYFAGLRLRGATNMWDGGVEILYANDAYVRNLTLARIGILPFFILASIIVFLWARSLLGDGPALLALVLFTTTPPVLAHAGLTTTDMAVTSGIIAVLFIGTTADGAPSVRRGLLLGAAVSLALLTKLTSLLFLPVSAVAIVVVRWYLVRRHRSVEARAWTVSTLAIAAAVVAVAIWATYRFSFGVPATRHAHGLPVPAPELVNALQQIVQHNGGGHDAYLLGDYRRTGWWYFFPVAIGVKTPLALLCLAVAGGVATARRGLRTGDWRIVAPLASLTAIVAVVLPANINIGVRHVLPIYPLCALLGAAGAVSLWRLTSRPQGARLAAVALVAWQLGSSAAAHPDYLAYFNVTAGPRPERVLLDSDLDWGQDLLRLADTVTARRIPALSIAYFGTADPARHGMPNVTRLAPTARPTGWVAASQRALLHPAPRYVVYHWLNAYPPVARAGKSILLFYVPSGGQADPSSKD